MRSFIEKDGTTLRLLIGKDPYIYANQLKSPKYKDSNYPLDFIKTDIHELNVTEEYKDAIRLLLDYCSKSNDSKIQIRVFRKMRMTKRSSYIPNVISSMVSKTV